MGSPLGPTLANAFLCHYEKEWLDNYPPHFKPIGYRRYVDDVFVLFSSKEHLQPLVDYMNKQHRCIKFTFTCSSCNATYYGKTERHLNVRSGEHIGLSPLTGNRVACKPSAISDHLLLHEHNNSSFNDFSILCCENNAFKLSLRASILIKRDSPELNRNVSSIPLLLSN